VVDRIDPNSLELQATPTTATLLTLSRAATANRGSANLVLLPERRARIVDRDANGGEALLVTGQRGLVPPSADSVAFGLVRDDGHVIVVDPGKSLLALGAIGKWVRDLGQALGVDQWLWSVPTTKLRLGIVRSEGGPAVSFRYGTPPSAKRFFPQTPIVTPQVWQPLQAQRVRYFRPKAASPKSRSTSGSGPPIAVPAPETAAETP
jgi:hypothetical protein